MTAEAPEQSNSLAKQGAAMALFGDWWQRRDSVYDSDSSPDWMGIYTTTALGGLMSGVDTGLVCAGIYWLLWRLQRDYV